MELARNLKTESVSRLYPTPPRTVTTQQTVADAVALMRQHNVGCVLVYEDEQVVGIFTERDLLTRVLAEDKPLSLPLTDCMTRAPICVDPQDPIGLAYRRMAEGGHRHLPVINAKGEAVGILSSRPIT